MVISAEKMVVISADLLSGDFTRKNEVDALQQKEYNLKVFMSFRHFVTNYQWQVSNKAPHL